MIHQAYEIGKKFIATSHRSIDDSEVNNQILMRDYDMHEKRSNSQNEKEKDQPQYDKRWARFGGKAPFSYVDNPKIEEELKKQYQKDKDVWDPPEDRPKNERKPMNNNRGGGGGGYNANRNQPHQKGPEKKDDKRRNYDKPWKGDDNKKKDAKDPKEKDPKEGKSEFLLHFYPDGVGPDVELIEMIEKEVVESNPNVKFEDIAELEQAKKTLQEAVLLPLLMPDFFVGIRRPWKGVLLFGPPGTGKTLLAKALATQGKTTFFNVSATTFASKWRGESEKLVRILFEMARFYAPSTIFIDEVDSIGTKRGDGDNEASRRVMAEMLVQMDGVSSIQANDDSNSNDPNNDKPKIVMVLAATNHPWDLDDALRRRFEKRVYIPLPNAKGREEMFKINLKAITLEEDVKLSDLVNLTDGYSGADIANVCREAALMHMRRQLLKTGGKLDIMQRANNIEFQNELKAPVTQEDILTAIKNISKSVSKKDLVKYDEWTSEYANK